MDKKMELDRAARGGGIRLQNDANRPGCLANRPRWLSVVGAWTKHDSCRRQINQGTQLYNMTTVARPGVHSIPLERYHCVAPPGATRRPRHPKHAPDWARQAPTKWPFDRRRALCARRPGEQLAFGWRPGAADQTAARRARRARVRPSVAWAEPVIVPVFALLCL